MLTKDMLFGLNIPTLAGFVVMWITLTLNRMGQAGKALRSASRRRGAVCGRRALVPGYGPRCPRGAQKTNPGAGLVCQRQTGREEWREVKRDPEERIIAAAMDQAELGDVNERGTGARVEFKREGHTKVTITISREFVEQARALDLTTGELFAEAIRLAVPGALDLARLPPPRWH
jgi:hypothetical protein